MDRAPHAPTGQYNNQRQPRAQKPFLFHARNFSRRLFAAPPKQLIRPIRLFQLGIQLTNGLFQALETTPAPKSVRAFALFEVIGLEMGPQSFNQVSGGFSVFHESQGGYDAFLELLAQPGLTE